MTKRGILSYLYGIILPSSDGMGIKIPTWYPRLKNLEIPKPEAFQYPDANRARLFYARSIIFQ